MRSLFTNALFLLLCTPLSLAKPDDSYRSQSISWPPAAAPTQAAPPAEDNGSHASNRGWYAQYMPDHLAQFIVDFHHPDSETAEADRAMRRRAAEAAGRPLDADILARDAMLGIGGAMDMRDPALARRQQGGVGGGAGIPAPAPTQLSPVTVYGSVTYTQTFPPTPVPWPAPRSDGAIGMGTLQGTPGTIKSAA